MSDLEAFRTEVRAWVHENAPESLRGTSGSGPFEGYWGGSKCEETDPDLLRWRDLGIEKGWTAPSWPREYGGGGLTHAQEEIIHAEMKTIGVPRPVAGQGLAMFGPVLLEYGNDAQRAQHLPGIARGEVRWCQGYSEPNAGSDLANLQLKAERDGDEFVLNGQKIWTSHANLSDWICCLTRTDPNAPKKQMGISVMLADLNTPGITVRRIDLISGYSPFCETFFDNVRVPVDQLVGTENEGWTIAKAILGHERSSIGRSIARQPGSAQREVLARARKHLGAADGAVPDPLLRDELASLGMREEAFHLTLARIQQSAASGAPGPEGSITKIVGTELKQKRFELGMKVAGTQGLGWEGPGFDDDDLEYTRDWLRSRASTIEGGSSEIQRNIISKRVLGLPEGKK
ncbi:MAG: acyl-CoA dehydrogenase family protein [Deltaproteobacteria bacterium]|nr:acyl-CoA dehydrogenase family protein [Deltaproteobacteria bacterium]MBW2551461.1 acyl-CoA dehydrogenase family protein [Deltaproteobacteria bacterium]MBW2627112.1 acyl-CoA dehydrogenase family protein [Deltaproteobacteria bacterium]MBW2686942.1 acyl-CoA dehydrogenase family protein [Deltaproteobacteria bacterium]